MRGPRRRKGRVEFHGGITGPTSPFTSRALNAANHRRASSTSADTIYEASHT
jgi:hypothetical protein